MKDGELSVVDAVCSVEEYVELVAEIDVVQALGKATLNGVRLDVEGLQVSRLTQAAEEGRIAVDVELSCEGRQGGCTLTLRRTYSSCRCCVWWEREGEHSQLDGILARGSFSEDLKDATAMACRPGRWLGYGY